jgi:glycosyltransferase involved in cell wall biosynthesis
MVRDTVIAAARRAWRSVPLPLGIRAPIARTLSSIVSAPGLARLGPLARPELCGAGEVSVAGLHSAVLGIATSARLQLEALRALGIRASALDLSTLFARAEGGGREPDMVQAGASGAAAGPVVIHLNAPEMLHAMARLGPGALAGRWRVGYWAWELPRAPAHWARAFSQVHEVWVPSRFVAEALMALDPPVPVRVVPHPVAAFESAADRASVGWGADEVVFVTLFDMASSMARKNPEGVVDAYCAAFARPGKTRLVVKGVHADLDRTAWARLMARAGARPDIDIINAVWTGARTRAFIASADVLVSLHRAEGFGLVPAEAMRAGTAVIATDWSGSQDFLAPGTAMLVQARTVPVRDPQGLYGGAGQVWAEPDLASAAQAMQALTDPSRRGALAARAQAHIAALFDPPAWRASLPQSFIDRTVRV